MIRISQLKLPVDHTFGCTGEENLSAVKDKKKKSFLPGRLYADPWMHGKSRI